MSAAPLIPEREKHEMLRFARNCHMTGGLDFAEQLYQILLLKFPHFQQAKLDYARLCIQRKTPAKAREQLDQIIASGGNSPDAYFLRASLARRRGDKTAALADIDLALALRQDFVECHRLFSEIEMDGPEYKSLFQELQQVLSPKVYCEIGVENGSSLKLAHAADLAVGIDPAPHIAEPLAKNARVYAMPSDDFFLGEACKILNGAPINLGFIDGLHEAKQALRDVIHMERHAAKGAILMLHDVVPLNAATATATQNTMFWSGDVWRTVMALVRFFPDLDILTLKSPPTGLTFVRGIDPDRKISAEQLAEIYAYMEGLSYSDLHAEKAKILNIQTFDQAKLRAFVLGKT